MSYFSNIIQQIYPRILTQLSRDPHSTTYGCFDRNWWHYKIRDYPSIILQQGGYFLDQLSDSPDFEDHKKMFSDLAIASVNFWTERSLKKGAYEEYYPWEDGYPPLAFSSLAAAKIIYNRKLESEDISKALQKASKKLLTRFESKAANQQIAGLAALGVIKAIQPSLVPTDQFEKIIEKTLQLQDEEGWYMEYDGPDLGYLSVSIDCLWDLYDFTNNDRFLKSAEKAFSFISDLVIQFDGNIGMHNSRNTDYIVPYGISRFVFLNNSGISNKAAKVLDILYRNIGTAKHFFTAVDDRYWSHYIGHSVVRAENLLQNLYNIKKEPISINASSLNFKNAGYLIQSFGDSKILINTKKGGVFSIKNNETYYSNFGWIIKGEKEQFVNHWWDNNLVVEANERSLKINGQMVGHNDNNSNPFKHIALRILSFGFGHHIISLLKNQLIFKNKKSRYNFERIIMIQEGMVSVSDSISNLSGSEEIEEAPRFSKRHVASADSYHHEDHQLSNGFKAKRETEIKNGLFKAQTFINLKA